MPEISDRDIFDCLIQHDHTNTSKMDKIEVLLKGIRALGVRTNQECIDFLGKFHFYMVGSKFRFAMAVPKSYTNKQVVDYLFENVCLIHLSRNMDKFNLIM